MAPAVLLCLATSGPRGEVGLRLPDGRLEVRALGTGAARGRGLLPAVRDLVRESGLRLPDLSVVVVDLGPGSFTGTRVGVTAAKSLAWALGVPAVGVLSLAALAAAAPPGTPVLALRDAGRGQAYFARYGPGTPGARPVLAGPARGGAEGVRRAQGDAVPVGEEADRLAAALGLPGAPLVRAAGAAAVLAAAREPLERGDFPPPHLLAPVYLQPSTPELRLGGEGATLP